MAIPVSEQIAVKVRTRLMAIDEDDGYETTVDGVIRPTRINTSHPKDYQIIVTQGDKRRNLALSHMGNPPATAWDMPFYILGQLRPSENDTTAIATLKNTFEADCMKALCDANSWHDWDGLAINSMISTAVDLRSSDGSVEAFRIVLTVTFRTDETNPYNLRA